MRRTYSALTAALLLAGCAHETSSHPPQSPVAKAKELKEGFDDRAGLVLESDAYGDSARTLIYLDQGWGPAETLWFYHADQGSMLLPYKTLVNLEQPGSEAKFIAPENMARFRMLNQHPSPGNPDGLPVGFARHGDQVGLTCAACHTTQINYQGTAMRIDGAPAQLDMPALLHAITEALTATLAEPARLSRFAAAVNNGKTDAASLDAARISLQQSLSWFESYEKANHPAVSEGFARLDAVGRIINQAIRFTSGPENSLTLSAPASYPMLWDTPRHDYVQWTAFSTNSGAGSLGRNTGEVIGVFANVEVKHYETEEDAKKGYPNSVNSPSLVAMEESLRKLQSPQWPEPVLPPIDRTLATRGQTLYQQACSGCHALLDRDDPRRKVVAMVTGVDVVGTDATAARGLVSARMPAGKLEGAISPLGTRYGATVSALELLGNLVIRTMATHPASALAAMANAKANGQEKTPKQGNHTSPTDANPRADLLSYKARPLNGIWAAAPYLHNGSVPTLYDLLLPPEQRPVTFSTGRLEFDPRHVGYVSQATGDGAGPFVLDTRLPGNSNQGHLYGVNLTDEDRWALVEYLKTL